MLRIDDVHDRVRQMDSMTLDDVKEEKNCRNLCSRHLEEIQGGWCCVIIKSASFTSFNLQRFNKVYCCTVDPAGDDVE